MAKTALAMSPPWLGMCSEESCSVSAEELPLPDGGTGVGDSVAGVGDGVVTLHVAEQTDEAPAGSGQLK